MLTTTFATMHCEHTLPVLTLPQQHKDRLKRKRRKMSGRGPESSTLGSDLATGISARVKRFHSKSRKGCLTCRQRRVKCDEQRTPNCLRCDKGGYVCEWQDTRQGRPRASEDSLSTTPTRSPSLATLYSDDDSTAHPFFSENVVAHIANLFADMAQSFIGDASKSSQVNVCISSFYYQFVLHASQTTQIIRKTLTALCGLFRRNHSRASSPATHEYITRYSEAVTDLRTSSRELAPDIVLIASILFANCEYLMGDLCSAVWHLRSGARILRERRDMGDGRLSAELSETLGKIFEAFDHGSVDLDCNTPGSDYLDTIAEQPFDNLSQANTNLLQIYSHTFALLKVGLSHPRHISPAAHDFQRWSASWKQRITSLKQSLDTDQLPWLDLLQGQQSALNSVIGDMSISRKTSSHSQLDDLVPQITSFLQTCSEPFPDSNAVRPYGKNVGLILPLFVVALRCVNAQMCESAVSLLSRLKIVEGALNSCCAHAIARVAANARYAARFSTNGAVDTFDDNLPVAEIKKITPLNSGSELDVTISLANNYTESNAIVAGYCPNPGTADQLSTILESSGFQGPVLAWTLEGCMCNDGI